MDIFYGGAIQGAQNRSERAAVHQTLIEKIKKMGYHVLTEHTTGKSYEEAIQRLEKSIGPLPKDGLLRRQYVRDKMIEFVESDIKAAVFELSIPSLGTGIEFAHAYLRPRMGLKMIPVIGLYQKNYWPNKLSTMIRGISKEKISQVIVYDYDDVADAERFLETVLKNLKEQ